MRVVVWLVEGTWPACVDAASELTPPHARIELLHVLDPALAEGVHGAYAGLVGRHGHDPGDMVEAAAAAAERALLDAAGQRLGRPSRQVTRRGRPEHEVVATAVGADLLIAARDGDHTSVGPASLAPPTRYVVDHAPCRVLLVWPDEAPTPETVTPDQPH